MCREEKRALRETFLRVREAVKSKERDERIAENALAAFGEKSSFFVYLSFGTEVGTAALIEELRARGKTVCVPRLWKGEMLCVPRSDRLKAGKYGILEPEEGEDTPCETVFAPLLAFDGEGYRLGYGGGYYDRYFAAHPGALRVGLAYEGQAADLLPHGAHDVALDAVVTECGVRYFPRRNA